MPRYLVETPSTTTADLARAMRLAAERFPEVAFELRYAVCGEHGGDVWVCRATSPTHVSRWAQEAQLEVRELRQIEAEVAPGARTGGL